jgi:2,3-bisphosphoglycerate-dependent phosphoglycerate mutase
LEDTRFCIVRHGETDWNVERRIQGHIDVPLNAAGRAQATATAAGLAGFRFAAVYSSDLVRAWTTAELAVSRLGLEVRAEAGLRERHYGVFQGLTAAEAAERLPIAHARYLARDPHYDFEAGESLSRLAARVTAAVEALAERHRGQVVLLVSHGGVLDICYRRATGRDLSTPRDFPIPNAALNWIEVGPAGWCLRSWADRRHLARTLEESAE